MSIKCLFPLTLEPVGSMTELITFSLNLLHRGIRNSRLLLNPVQGSIWNCQPGQTPLVTKMLYSIAAHMDRPRLLTTFSNAKIYKLCKMSIHNNTKIETSTKNMLLTGALRRPQRSFQAEFNIYASCLSYNTIPAPQGGAKSSKVPLRR